MTQLKKRKDQPHGAIRPRYEVEANPDELTPYFCLRYLSGDFCLSQCQTAEKAAFADRLHKLSSMTWVQIKSAPRHGLGFEKIPRESIRTGIPPHITPDTNFIAFRFSGMKPMVGYRQRATFYVLWLDRTLTLYPH